MGELDSLPYLDIVLRESLRLHSVIDGGIRVALRDDVVPFERPFVGKDGKSRDRLKYVCTTLLLWNTDSQVVEYQREIRSLFPS